MGGTTPDVRVVEEDLAVLPELVAIPIRFIVHSVLHAVPDERGLGGIRLTEHAVDPPYEKDYDAIAGQGPARWPDRFDVSHWGVLTARRGRERIGSAVIAWRSADAHLLEGRTDIAVLWDLRVAPEHRGRGVGSALFRAASEWAAQRECRWLKVETQNTNVPACRFYVRQGCSLGGVHLHAYAELAAEVQLLWYLDLQPRRTG